MPPYFSVLLLLLIAWGALAFGANYDWAYTPLFWAAAAIGVLGLFSPGSRVRRPIAWPIVVAAALIALIGFVQLIPLAPATVAAISPATDQFLRKYDVAYQLSTAMGAAGYRHALSIKPAGTWLSLAALGALTLLLVGTARGLGQRSLRALASGLVFVGFTVALVGIVQSGLYSRAAAVTEKIYGFWKPLNEGTNPYGPFVNHNHFAGWMLLALPVGVGYFLSLVASGQRGTKPEFRERALWLNSAEASRVILAGLATGVMALSLVLTVSRSGISCLILSLALSAHVVVRRRTKGARRSIMLAFLVLVLVFSVAMARLDEILVWFGRTPNDFWSRFGVWRDAYTIFQAFPWLGTGLNTFGTAMTIYQTTRLEVHTIEAHNDYVQLLSEGGVALAIVVVAAIVLLGREIRRRFREDADDQTTYWIRVGATTGLVAIAFQELVEFSLQMPGNATLFAVVAALAIWPAGDRSNREVSD